VLKRCSSCGRLVVAGGVTIDDRFYCSAWCLEGERRRAKEVADHEASRLAYQASLGRLKENPTDPDRREEALRLGRLYAAWTRHRFSQDSAITLFDEVALANDLQAASAGATAGSNAASAVALSLEQRLKNLETLRERGLVSEEEYRTKRSQLLAEI
jgi:hypothetical protein